MSDCASMSALTFFVWMRFIQHNINTVIIIIIIFDYYIISIIIIIIIIKFPRREAEHFWCLPPVWNLRAFSLIQLFYICSFVLLPSPVAPSVLFCFCFGPILLISFSLNLHFPKGRLFCMALLLSLFLFLFYSDYELSTLVGGMCSISCHMALVLAFIHVLLQYF